MMDRTLRINVTEMPTSGERNPESSSDPTEVSTFLKSWFYFSPLLSDLFTVKLNLPTLVISMDSSRIQEWLLHVTFSKRQRSKKKNICMLSM